MGRRVFRSQLCLMGLCLVLLSSCCGDGGEAVLFEDSFDDPLSGWGEDERDEFERGYDRDEVYYFELYEPNWFAWARPGATKQADVRVQVDARVVSEVTDAHYGVICRYVDVDNFYYFALSADGHYGIFRREDGDIDVLTGDGSGMMYSSTIRTGDQVNRVVAICQEDTLKLYANGGLLASVTDDTHTKGDVGVGAGRGPEGRVRVHLDGFVVTVP